MTLDDIREAFTSPYRERLAAHDARTLLWPVETPLHRFQTFIRPVGEWAVATTVREGFDAALLEATLDRAEAVLSVLGAAALDAHLSLASLPGHAAFDRLLLMPPSFHKKFEHPGMSSALQPRSLEVAPVHHSEFTGRENADLFDIIRQDAVTVDWTRAPQPQIWCLLRVHQYDQPIVIVKKPKLMMIDELAKWIDTLADPRSKFIELRNYADRTLRLERAEAGVQLSGAALSALVSYAEAVERAREVRAAQEVQAAQARWRIARPSTPRSRRTTRTARSRRAVSPRSPMIARGHDNPPPRSGGRRCRAR